MAIDEQLLNDAVEGIPSLRFYEWARPTISLGHFQSVQGGAIPERFTGLDTVTRLSGGGAILHDRELTYSCAIPPTHPIVREPGNLYDLVHFAIIDVLQSRGVACQFRGEAAFVDKSFLCFSRGDARDLVIGRQKIVGSAQRRRRGAVLQHGSLLLQTSDFAPEFTGIQELTGVALTPQQLVPRLIPAILNRLEYNIESVSQSA